MPAPGGVDVLRDTRRRRADVHPPRLEVRRRRPLRRHALERAGKPVHGDGAHHGVPGRRVGGHGVDVHGPAGAAAASARLPIQSPCRTRTSSPPVCPCTATTSRASRATSTRRTWARCTGGTRTLRWSRTTRTGRGRRRQTCARTCWRTTGTRSSTCRTRSTASGSSASGPRTRGTGTCASPATFSRCAA